MGADHPHGPPHAGGPIMTRRSMIKTVGITAGAGTVAAADHSLSPVGEADALVPALVGVGVGMYAGVKINDYLVGTDGDVDTNDVLEDRIYNIATSVADGREAFEKELQTQFIDRPTDQTPYANAAWQEIRATAAREIVNGGTQAEAEQAAKEALDIQTSISVINLIERLNTGLEALAESLVIDQEESVGAFKWSGSATVEPTTIDALAVHSSPGLYEEEFSEVEAAKTKSGEYMLLEADADRDPINLPAKVEDIPDREEPLTLYVLALADGEAKLGMPNGVQFWGVESEYTRTATLKATHSDLSTKKVLNFSLYENALQAVDTEYNNITSNLSEYVSELYNGITEGAIDPSDIFTSRQIINEFSNSSEQARMAAELMAVGGNVPGDAGYKAEISHPDLASETLWVRLYPQFGTKSPKDIAAGVTLSPSEYELAYIGYENAVDGSFETRVLSGDSTLEILNVDGIKNEDKAEDSDSHDSTAGTDGGLTIWDESQTSKSTPEPLLDPSGYDGWMVEVNGSDGTTDHIPLSDVVDNGDGTYSVPSSTIPDGTSIDSAAIEPGADYQQPVTHVSDPTNVDTEATKAQLEEQRKTIDELKDALNDDSIFGGGTFGDLAISSDLLVYAGAAILGLFALNAASS